MLISKMIKSRHTADFRPRCRIYLDYLVSEREIALEAVAVAPPLKTMSKRK